jgi:hypothetical protein
LVGEKKGRKKKRKLMNVGRRVKWDGNQGKKSVQMTNSKSNLKVLNVLSCDYCHAGSNFL